MILNILLVKGDMKGFEYYEARQSSQEVFLYLHFLFKFFQSSEKIFQKNFFKKNFFKAGYQTHCARLLIVVLAFLRERGWLLCSGRRTML